MTCDLCGRPLTTKGDVVVWLPSGLHRCFPCWLATERALLLWQVRWLVACLALDRLWRDCHLVTGPSSKEV